MGQKCIILLPKKKFSFIKKKNSFTTYSAYHIHRHFFWNPDDEFFAFQWPISIDKSFYCQKKEGKKIKIKVIGIQVHNFFFLHFFVGNVVLLYTYNTEWEFLSVGPFIRIIMETLRKLLHDRHIVSFFFFLKFKSTVYSFWKFFTFSSLSNCLNVSSNNFEDNFYKIDKIFVIKVTIFKVVCVLLFDCLVMMVKKNFPEKSYFYMIFPDISIFSDPFATSISFECSTTCLANKLWNEQYQ